MIDSTKPPEQGERFSPDGTPTKFMKFLNGRTDPSKICGG